MGGIRGPLGPVEGAVHGLRAERVQSTASPVPPAPGTLDVQTLLVDALRRLARGVDCERACVWWWETEGEPLVAAAHYRSGTPKAVGPSDRETAAAARSRHPDLPRAFDLGSTPIDAGLKALGERHGFGAGRWVRTHEGEAVAVVWIGGREHAPGTIRPRQLAYLDECADALADPVSTLVAARRLHALDEEIRRLDRLSSLGDLLAEIVHEIRNPLVSVKTFLQLLPGREDDPEFTGEFRSVVMDEMRRLERLLDSVVQHARPATLVGDDDETSIAACLDSLAGLLRHRALDREVVLETRVDEGLPPLGLAQDAVRQLLLNLSLNAIDVSPSGGRVTLTARAASGGVEVRVDDEGPGVPVELREKVFEPFFSTRRERAGGLGLAISRRLASDAGGRLEVAESPSGGASFRAWLPAADPGQRD